LVDRCQARGVECSGRGGAVRGRVRHRGDSRCRRRRLPVGEGEGGGASKASGDDVGEAGSMGGEGVGARGGAADQAEGGGGDGRGVGDRRGVEGDEGLVLLVDVGVAHAEGGGGVVGRVAASSDVRGLPHFPEAAVFGGDRVEHHGDGGRRRHGGDGDGDLVRDQRRAAAGGRAFDQEVAAGGGEIGTV